MTGISAFYKYLAFYLLLYQKIIYKNSFCTSKQETVLTLHLFTFLLICHFQQLFPINLPLLGEGFTLDVVCDPVISILSKGNRKKYASPKTSNQSLRLLLEEKMNHLLWVPSSSISYRQKPVRACGRRMSAPLMVSDQRSHKQDHAERNLTNTW